jgi:putative ABC transport system substrate-binding protein
MSNPSLRRRELITLLGSGIAWPLAARAREAAKVPTVGVLWHAGSPDEEQPFFGALQKGFSDLGYVEGQNMMLVHRFPNELPDRFKSMAAELVEMRGDVLVGVTAGAVYETAATSTIPIVFVLFPDPVRAKLVESIARPGGNATGLASVAAEGFVRKRVQLLQSAIPGLSRLGALINPSEGIPRAYLDEARAAASDLGLAFQEFQASSLAELDEAFEAMPHSGIQGLLVAGGGLFYQGRHQIAKLAATHRLPIGVWATEIMGDGVFMSYGPSLAAMVRRAPAYVDKILKGAKPSELPVELPTQFQLIVNLKTARACGVEVPQMLIAQADDVIE